MENHFYTLFDFLVYTKGAAYILMGLTLLGILGFWLYLTGRDEDEGDPLAQRAAPRPWGELAHAAIV